MSVIQELLMICGKEETFGYKTSAGKKLYLIYLLLGGVYESDLISRELKIRFLILYNLASAFLIIVTTTCLFTSISTNFFDIMYTLFPLFLAAYLCYLTPFITYIFRNEIKQVIDYIDSKMDKLVRKENSTRAHSRISIFGKKYLRRWIILSIYMLLPLFDSLLFYNEENIYNFKHFCCPFIFRSYLTPKQLQLLYVVVYIISIFPFLTYTALTEYFEAMTASLRDSCDDLCLNLLFQSNIMKNSLEGIQNEELEKENVCLDWKRKETREKFMRNIPIMIRKHQELIRLVQ